MPIRVRLVGRVAIEHDQLRVSGGALDARRSRLLLAALATAGGPITADDLAGRIWNDPPPSWPSALRNALAALRTALDPIGLGGQNLVVTDRTGWRLAPAAVTDLDEASAAIASAERAMTAEPADPQTALVDAEAALALTTGEVLPEDAGLWIDELRERRQALQRRALGFVADAAIGLGRWSRVQDASAALLDVDPLDEAAHRRVILALMSIGDRSGAIRAFDRCRNLLTEELGIDPGPETTELYLRVLQSGAPPGGTLPPRPRNRFVGRDAERQRILAALEGDRCVTLVGPGGIGKSRLALEVAHDRFLEAPGGRFWASLGDVAESELILPAIAAALGVEGSTPPLVGVIAALAPGGRTLLVLDGGERHRDILADLMPRLLEGAPELILLCTSRSGLGGAVETRVPVGPLGAGPELLRARLVEAGSRHPLGDQDLDSAARLCDRLGGIPLAIELAISQLATMSIDDLVDRVVSGGPGSALDALIEQGYDALDADETRLLRALSVVEGGLPLSLAQALATPSLSGPRVARLLGLLADTGLVSIDRSGPRWRYGVDAHIRPFARAQSSPAERSNDLGELARAVAEVPPADATAPPGPFRQSLDAARDAVRTVLAAAADGRIDRQFGVHLAFRLHRYWASTAVAEGRYWFDRLLDGAVDGPDTSLARFAAGYLAYWAGDPAGLPVLRRAGAELAAAEPAFATRAYIYAAGLSDEADEPEHALSEIARARELAPRASAGLVAMAELGAAAVLAERRDPAAVVAVDRALDQLPKDAPEAQRLSFAANGALAAWRSGRVDAAHRLIRLAHPLLTESASISRAQLAMAMAGAALVEGDAAEAARWGGSAVENLQEIGADRELPIGCAIAARAAARTGDLDTARRMAVIGVEATRTIGLAAAVALALEAAVFACPDHEHAAALATTAAQIRVHGDRPSPPGLELAPHADVSPLLWPDALALARDMLD